jgi:hypothetical protein
MWDGQSLEMQSVVTRQGLDAECGEINFFSKETIVPPLSRKESSESLENKRDGT